MKRLLQFAGVVLLACAHVLAQGVRVGDGQPALSTTTVPGVGSSIVIALPNASISFCTAPANAVPCTNKATTFSDSTLTGACPTSQQVVLAGTNQCVASTDARGNWGVWVAAGQYEYTITKDGISSGPFPITAGAAAGGGSGTWGAITGTLASQTDLQTALNAKAPLATPSFTGQIGIDTPSVTNGILYNHAGLIDSLAGFTVDPATGQVSYPAPFQLHSTFPGSDLTCAAAESGIGFDNTGKFRVCENGGAAFSPGLIASFPDGTATVPGFGATNHPELGISTVLSAIAFTVTNVQRTSNVVTITVSTPTNALNWPVGATISTFNIPSPFDVLNCARCTLTAVTGGTPTSTFTYTLNGTDVASSATSGSASIFDMVFAGYAQQFGRLESSTANPATRGSIRFAKNDDIWHRSIDGTTNYVLIQGNNDQAQLGDTTGAYIPGPIKLTQQASPSNQAGANDLNLYVDSTSHVLTCKLGSGGTNCMPAGSGTVTTTGTPATGNLTKFSGATAITNGDLSGDCTTAGTLAITCTKTSGTVFAASATTDATNATNIASGTLNAARLPATVVQTGQSNTYTAGTQSFSAAAHTLPAVTGTTAGKPATCTVGEVYFANDATAGQNLFFCTATNTWTQQLNSGGGGAICSAGSCLLDSKDTAAGIVGNNTAQIVYSFTIPGGTLGIHDCVVATVNFTTAGSASNVYTWTFGSNSQTWTTGTTGGNGFSQYRVCNTGATNTQRAVFAPGSIATTDIATSDTNPAIDTTVNQDIAFKFNAANTVTVTPKMWTVEYLKHQ